MRTELDEWRQSQVLSVLLELTRKSSPVWATPEELLASIQESGLGVVSKRELALYMRKLGLHTRVLSKDGHYSRYYTLASNELAQVKRFMTTQETENNAKNEAFKSKTQATQQRNNAKNGQHRQRRPLNKGEQR